MRPTCSRRGIRLGLAAAAALALAGCSADSQQEIRDAAATQAAAAGPTVQAGLQTALPTLQSAATTVAGALGGAGLGTREQPIVMSFVPSGEREAIVTGSEEIKTLLEQETGLVFEPNIATSYAAVIEAMGAGNAQVAWIPTFAYLLAHEKFGVRPVLVVERNGVTTYAGQIIAGADSGIKTVADLKGKKFCRPDALSASGWIAPSIALRKAGLDPADLGQVIDSGTHDGVATAVYNGQCDAGATYEDVRDRVAETLPDIKDKVAVIAVSDPIPNDNVSVAAGLPDELVQKITAGLLALTKTEAGRAALQTVYGIEALQPTDDTYYDDFRATLGAAGVDPQDFVK
jgi:phosphonate transport system substrate-binding protein